MGGSPITVDIVAADAVPPSDRAVWGAIQAADPAYRSPLLSPEFAAAVGRVRPDARVAIFRSGGEPVAFFAFHHRPGGFGRPIGAPFSDYHGVVAISGFEAIGVDVIARAGLKAFRHSGLIDPKGVFAAVEDGPSAYAIELTGSPEAHLETVRAASPKKFKNYRRLQNRLAELGALELRASTSRDDFKTILAWKSAQFERTGVQDVLRPDWVRALMTSLFEARDGQMSGLMLTLHAGDRLVGGHFGVRAGPVYHPWIASTAPDLAAYSPGQAFLDQAIRAMPGLGLQVYDLGVGHDHYKLPFASTTTTVGAGLQSVSGSAGSLNRAAERAWTIGPLGRSAAIDKVRRRLDHIATTDPSFRGRVQGVAEAFAGTRRRSLAGEATA